MNEGKKRRDWVKNAAIVFLAIMLVLTFFSNTIMNYSLPEVAAQYCYSGQITNKVKGTGVVEAEDPYRVEYKQSRKVASVEARVGDYIEKGSVIYTLEEGESEELVAAEATLAGLKNTYDRKIITEQIPKSITDSVEKGTTATISKQQSNIEAQKKKITNFENQAEKYRKEIAEYDKQIELWSTDTTGAIPERVALLDAQEWESKWSIQLGINKQLLDDKKDDLAADPGNATLIDEVKNAEAAYETSRNKLAEYQAKVNDLENGINRKIAELNSAKAVANNNLNSVNTSITAENEKLAALVGKYGIVFELQDMLAQIAAQEKVVEELKKTQTGGEIVAPISGTLLSLSASSGQKIEAGSTVATIQRAGKGFTLTLTLPSQKASLLSVGDEGEITNSWWYSDVHARVSSIRPDPSNPSQSKLVTFEIEGSVSSGQSLTISAGHRTANYDVIVPSSAIREDNKGKFIYRVTQKSTPLGVRYYATRVNVNVLAEDESNSAISSPDGELSSWEYIITNSTKPIDDGKQVRLKD